MRLEPGEFATRHLAEALSHQPPANKEQKHQQQQKRRSRTEISPFYEQ